MFVRVTRAQYDPARITDEEAVTLGERVAAATKAQPGFVSYQGGADHENGVLLAISTWQDKESAHVPREALGDVIAEIVNLGVQMEPPVICEIEVNVTA